MTFEELNRAIEFIVEQQARLSATMDRQEERSRQDYEWSRGMIKQLAESNQHVVELLASNVQRLDQNDREQRKSQREFREFEKQSQTRHEEAMARLDRILDRLTRDNPNPRPN